MPFTIARQQSLLPLLPCSGNYNEYFGFNTNVDACVYLMLANDLIHTLRPDVSCPQQPRTSHWS